VTHADRQERAGVYTSEWEQRGSFQIEPGTRTEVVELARLLPRVAALAECVNSEAYSDRDRERLRELVPVGTYFLLLLNMADLRSGRARRESRAMRRVERRIIDLLGFFEDYKALAER
jgi:hypothetical protein